MRDAFSEFDLNPANQLPSYERPPSNLLLKSVAFKLQPSIGLTAEKITNFAGDELRYNQARDGLLLVKVNIEPLARMEGVRQLKRGSDVTISIYQGENRHHFRGTIKSIYRRDGYARLKIQPRQLDGEGEG